ncbi:MAG: beta-ketoacyl-[acyl-carrier-protein] synthase II, partial [Nitrospirae bacterium]
GEHADQLKISSIKSMIGETYSAAGAFGVVAAVGCIENNFIPPTINYEQKDPDCTLNYVPNNAVEMKLDHIMVNTMNPSGNSTSVIISKFNDEG